MARVRARAVAKVRVGARTMARVRLEWPLGLGKGHLLWLWVGPG